MKTKKLPPVWETQWLRIIKRDGLKIIDQETLMLLREEIDDLVDRYDLIIKKYGTNLYQIKPFSAVVDINRPYSSR